MSVHQIHVSMAAHVWTASTAIGACVPQAGAGLTVSSTRTSAAVVPVSMPTPAKIFREDTSVIVRLDGRGRTVTLVCVTTYIPLYQTPLPYNTEDIESNTQRNI